MRGFKFNEREYRKLVELIAADLNAADQHFRATHAGLPVDVVRADAPGFLPVSITLSDEDLDAYARAVATGEAFEFLLQG